MPARVREKRGGTRNRAFFGTVRGAHRIASIPCSRVYELAFASVFASEILKKGSGTRASSSPAFPSSSPLLFVRFSILQIARSCLRTISISITLLFYYRHESFFAPCFARWLLVAIAIYIFVQGRFGS